jgi:hypothetical protein
MNQEIMTEVVGASLNHEIIYHSQQGNKLLKQNAIVLKELLELVRIIAQESWAIKEWSKDEKEIIRVLSDSATLLGESLIDGRIPLKEFQEAINKGVIGNDESRADNEKTDKKV